MGAGGWKMGYCVMSTEFQFLKMKGFWRWLVETIPQHYVCNAPELCT